MKSNQSGGVVSFVVVTLALIGLLAGGLYLSKSQARQARDNGDATPQVVTDTSKDESKSEDKASQEAAPKENDKDTQTAPTTGDTRQQDSGRSTATPSTDRVANTGPSSEIPATGPADVVAYTFALGSLAFTSTYLIRSRRLVRASALKS